MNLSWKSVITQASHPMLALNESGQAVHVNAAYLAVSGFQAKEVQGKHLQDLMSVQGDGEESREIWRQIQKGKSWSRPLLLRAKDGTLFQKLASVDPLRNDAGNIAFYVVNLLPVAADLAADIHSSQLRRLEAIGRLAGGISHDFNNLLSVIMNFADFVEEAVKDRPSLQEDVQEIKRAAQRAAELTSQLLVFSRREAVHPRLISINRTVEQTERLLRRTLGENIQIMTRYAPELPPVFVDPGRIEQILLNLAFNARDAMPKGGKLILETSITFIQEDYARERVGIESGAYVLLSVSDTGCGMSTDVTARAFEPFFTTKPIGKGTGLGLPMVYGIMKRAGGNVWLYSEPGVGTTVKMYLPVSQGEVPPEVAEEASSTASGQGMYVLVVEDEPALRRVTKRILKHQGYHVLEAEDGVEALGVLEERNGDIALVLSDLVMPRMSGKELAIELAKRYPGVKILFMSGYTEVALKTNGLMDSGTIVISKPFTQRELLRQVEAVLNKDP